MGHAHVGDVVLVPRIAELFHILDTFARHIGNLHVQGKEPSLSYQKRLRRIAALISIAICAGLILGAYSQEYGQEYQPPPLLNTTFKYWTLVPGTNQTKPYLWKTDFLKGPDDLLRVTEDTVQGESALGMHVYQDGLNDTFDWAMLHVRQDLRGKAAATVFENNVGVWVYPTFSYHADPINKNPLNAFGIEINDGTHIVWFVFSRGEGARYEFRLHRIIIVTTPLNQWSYREVNIKAEYEAAKWPVPGSFSFILMTGATKPDPGWYAGYFKMVTVTGRTTVAAQSSEPTSRITASVSILGLTNLMTIRVELSGLGRKADASDVSPKP